MGKTLDLREVIKSRLDSIDDITDACYEIASDDVDYPYVVFSFDNIDLDDTSRDDLIMVVDVWTKNSKQADNIADAIESLFNGLNAPTNTILPTFYRYSRKSILDEDKTIKRRELKFQIQNYER